MVDWGSKFSFFQGIHVRIDLRIDISISIGSMATKYGRQVHLEELTQMKLIKQVMVMSSNQDHMRILKHLLYQSSFGHQTLQHGHLPQWATAHKVMWHIWILIVIWSCEIMWEKTQISTSTVLMVTKADRWWLTLRGFYP